MDDLYNNMCLAAKKRETEKTKSLEKYKDSSKNRLLGVLNKKLNTSFIGALAKFEHFFGRIWGHGKKESECTELELRWRPIWEACRTEVLNNGNSQIRATNNELSQYDISWNRYKLILKEKEKNNE